MAPSVTAIILNYRTPLLAVKSVQALRTQTIAEQIEIIVVDNHSDDDSIGTLRVRLKGLPNVRIVETPKNLGFGRGNDRGIAHAKGDYLLIINPDNELERSSLERMVAVMEQDPSIGIVAPKLIHEDGTIRDSVRSFPRLLDVIAKRTPLRNLFPGHLKEYLQSDQDPDRKRTVDWAVGACLLMRREFFQELGGFDQRFFLFFEDIDLCRRCWVAGKRVLYLPEASATDGKKRLSEGGALSLLRHPAGRAHLRSALQYFWKWKGTLRHRTA